jgi:hypothetical protein
MPNTTEISSELLSALMNRLIPAVDDLPAAGDMGLA